MFHTQFVEVFITCLNAEFHIHRSNGPLATNVKLKTKKYLRTATILFFYILQEENDNNQNQKAITIQHSRTPTGLWSVAPTSQIRASTMLLILIVGNWNVWGWDGLQCHNVQTKCRRTRSLGRNVERGHTEHGDIISLVFPFRTETRLKVTTILHTSAKSNLVIPSTYRKQLGFWEILTCIVRNSTIYVLRYHGTVGRMLIRWFIEKNIMLDPKNSARERHNSMTHGRWHFGIATLN
jgi:hypothetical protein